MLRDSLGMLDNVRRVREHARGDTHAQSIKADVRGSREPSAVVRFKVSSKRVQTRVLSLIVAGALLALGLIFALAQRSVDPVPIHQRARRVADAGARVIRVGARDSLQRALNTAQPGDTIVLQAGVTFTGPFTIPTRNGDAYITIQSSRLSELPPAGQRVGPALGTTRRCCGTWTPARKCCAWRGTGTW